LERPTIRSGDDKLVGKSLDVTEIQLQDVLAGGGDNVVPLRQMNIPHWAIAALIGRTAKHVSVRVTLASRGDDIDVIGAPRVRTI
jgi:hypothetical protein